MVAPVLASSTVCATGTAQRSERCRASRTVVPIPGSRTASRAVTAERKDGAYMVLDLTILIFFGKHATRQHRRMRELVPTSSVRYLKQRVEEMLGRQAEEVEVLAGDRITHDSEVLSECGLGLRSECGLLVLVSYPELSREWYWESPPEGSLDGPRLACNVTTDFSQGMPSPIGSDSSDSLSNDALLQSRWPGEESKPRQPRPPLLLRSRPLQMKLSEECLCTDVERRLIESGSRFLLSVHCRIFLGLRCHQRRCVLAVSPHTVVSDIEERLIKWLGLTPDELLLTLGTVSLESTATLGAHHVHSEDVIGALAEYKDAV